MKAEAQVELAAPGVGVRSTLPGDTYASWSGTSMATPHVSAAAALVWSNNSDCTAAQIRQAMAATAQDLGASGPEYLKKQLIIAVITTAQADVREELVD